MRPGLSREQAEAGANVLYHQILDDEAKKVPKGAEALRDDFRRPLRRGASPSAGALEAAGGPS